MLLSKLLFSLFLTNFLKLARSLRGSYEGSLLNGARDIYIFIYGERYVVRLAETLRVWFNSLPSEGLLWLEKEQHLSLNSCQTLN